MEGAIGERQAFGDERSQEPAISLGMFLGSRPAGDSPPMAAWSCIQALPLIESQSM
jgi:hypothetical protein